MEMEAKWKKIIVILLKAGPDSECNREKNSETTVFSPFSSSGHAYVFDANDD